MYSGYGEDKREDRPVRLDRTEGTVVIEGRVYPAREIVEALAQSGYTEIRFQGDSLILGRRRVAPIFKSRKERAMAALCHGSLAYCCPMSKRCAQRDRALEILGLTKDDYDKMKSDAHCQFVDASRQHTSDDFSWSRRTSDRMANRPAVDRGFGSDDYQRDFDVLDRALQSDRTPHRENRGWRDEESSRRHQLEPGSEIRRSGNPFTDMPMDGSLMDEMRRSTESLACRSCNDESVDGIGSLFSQGELSPYKDESSRDSSQLNFCFSCGRTFEPGTKVCPFCGVPQ